MRYKVYFLITIFAIIVIGNALYFSSNRFYSVRYKVDKSGKILIEKSEYWIQNPYLMDLLPFNYKRNALIRIRSHTDEKFPDSLIKYYKKLSIDSVDYRSANGVFIINNQESVDRVVGTVTYEINGKLQFKGISVNCNGVLRELGDLN